MVDQGVGIQNKSTALKADTLYTFGDRKTWFIPHKGYVDARTIDGVVNPIGYAVKKLDTRPEYNFSPPDEEEFVAHTEYSFIPTSEPPILLPLDEAREVLTKVRGLVIHILKNNIVTTDAHARDTVMHLAELVNSRNPVSIGKALGIATLYLQYFDRLSAEPDITSTTPFKILQRRAVAILSRYYENIYSVSLDEALMHWSECLYVTGAQEQINRVTQEAQSRKSSDRTPTKRNTHQKAIQVITYDYTDELHAQIQSAAPEDRVIETPYGDIVLTRYTHNYRKAVIMRFGKTYTHVPPASFYFLPLVAARQNDQILTQGQCAKDINTPYIKIVAAFKYLQEALITLMPDEGMRLHNPYKMGYLFLRSDEALPEKHNMKGKMDIDLSDMNFVEHKINDDVTLKIYPHLNKKPGRLCRQDMSLPLSMAGCQLLIHLAEHKRISRRELSQNHKWALQVQAVTDAIAAIYPDQDLRVHQIPRHDVYLLSKDEPNPEPPQKKSYYAPEGKSIGHGPAPAETQSERHYGDLKVRLYRGGKNLPAEIIFAHRSMRISRLMHDVLIHVIEGMESKEYKSVKDIADILLPESKSRFVMVTLATTKLEAALKTIMHKGEMTLRRVRKQGVFLLKQDEDLPVVARNARVKAKKYSPIEDAEFTDTVFGHLTLRQYENVKGTAAALITTHGTARISQRMHDVMATIIECMKTQQYLSASDIAKRLMPERDSRDTLVSLAIKSLKEALSDVLPNGEMILRTERGRGVFLLAAGEATPTIIKAKKSATHRAVPDPVFHDKVYKDLTLRRYENAKYKPAELVTKHGSERITRVMHDALTMIIQGAEAGKIVTISDIAQQLFGQNSSREITTYTTIKNLTDALGRVFPDGELALHRVRGVGVFLLSPDEAVPERVSTNKRPRHNTAAPRANAHRVTETAKDVNAPIPMFNEAARAQYHFHPSYGLVIDTGPASMEVGEHQLTGRYFHLLGQPNEKPVFITDSNIRRLGYGALDTDKFIERLKAAYGDIYMQSQSPVASPSNTKSLSAAFNADKTPDTLAALLYAFRDARVQSHDGSVELRKKIFNMLVRQVSVFHNFATLVEIGQHLEFVIHNRKTLSDDMIWPYTSVQNFKRVMERIEQEPRKAGPNVQLSHKEKSPVIVNSANEKTDIERFLAIGRARGALVQS